MPGQAGPGTQYAALSRNLLWYKKFLQRVSTLDAPPTSTAATYNVQYCGSTKWTAVTAWQAAFANQVGDLVRQTAPTAGNERVFRCIGVSTTGTGTTGGAEPTWNLNYGGTTVDASILWQEVTGRSAYGWNAPHARLANALVVPWYAVGDWVYVSNNHAETQSSAMTITSQGTSTQPAIILCVNDAGSVPPVAADLGTTATITTTGASAVSLLGSAVYYGITFNCATGAGNNVLGIGGTSPGFLYFEACSLALVCTGTVDTITINAAGNNSDQTVIFYNTTVSFAHAGQKIQQNGTFYWYNTSNAVLGTVPTTLLSAGGRCGPFQVIGVDLSALGSGKNLVDISATANYSVYLQDCKLGASVSITTGAIASRRAGSVTLVNCDSSSTNYRFYQQTFEGTESHETNVVRTGGATDQTTPISRKMVSNGNVSFFMPLRSEPILFWNDSTSPVTITIPIITEGGGNSDLALLGLKTNEVWIEVEYLGVAGFPQGVYDVSSRAANFLTVPARQPLDSTSVWGNFLSAPVQQSLTATITPALKGPMRLRVMLARPNTTMYFDPKRVLFTPMRSFMIGESGFINEGGPPIGSIIAVRSIGTY